MKYRVHVHVLVGLLLFFTSAVQAQKTTTAYPSRSQWVDIAGTLGEQQGSVAGSYVHTWGLLRSKRLDIGVGARYSFYYGEKKDFITAAPARLTRTFTAPFLIVFAGQREENFDTLTVQRPFNHSVNLTFNLGYHISPRLYAGTNIDVIGFSFGPSSSAVFRSNGETTTEPSAKPASFNLLLTGDHDYGSLNSEFFLRYDLKKRWSIRAIYQFLFVEFESENVTQVASDGTEINRFRNKANNLGIGITYRL